MVVSNIAVEDLVGHWFLAATTSGYFAHHPRVDEAQFILEDRGGRFLRSRVRYSNGRRQRSFGGLVPRGQGNRRLRWWGSSAFFIAARSRWSMTSAPGGRIVMLRNPGSTVTSAGAVVLARIDDDVPAVRAAVAAAVDALGLTAGEHRDLAWRRRPAPLDA